MKAAFAEAIKRRIQKEEVNIKLMNSLKKSFR